MYYKVRIAMIDCDQSTRNKWLKLLSNTYESIRKSNLDSLKPLDDLVLSQMNAIVTYMNSYGALQDPCRSIKDLQDGIRLISFNDRNLSKSSSIHAGASKIMKDADKRKDQVIKNCNQKHPLHFFNNMGVLHFNTKKYSLAAYFLTKALRYLSLDGNSSHTTQKRAEIMHNLGLAFYKLQEYEKSINCFSEATELYSDKFSMWFWMGV